jgi:hypothetical protein
MGAPSLRVNGAKLKLKVVRTGHMANLQPMPSCQARVEAGRWIVLCLAEVNPSDGLPCGVGQMTEYPWIPDI